MVPVFINSFWSIFPQSYAILLFQVLKNLSAGRIILDYLFYSSGFSDANHTCRH